MKRYWKLAVLIPFIVFTIGIYYAEASVGGHPEYYIKTQKGNGQVASGIKLKGNYKYDAVTISTKGSTYQSDQSFWKSLDSYYYSTQRLKEMAKQYPQFMRGKQNPNAFYVDSRVIGYANINSQGQSDFRINVSIYDKKQKDSLSFEVKMPKQNPHEFVNAYNVQVGGQFMKLLTLNYNTNQATGQGPVVHLYTLDLNKKKVVADHSILSYASSGESKQGVISGINETDALKKPSNYIVFQMVHDNNGWMTNGLTTESSRPYAAKANTVNSRELFVYDIKSGKLSRVESKLVNELLQSIAPPAISQNGDDLFLISTADPKGPRVIRYSLSEKKISSDLIIPLKDLQANAEIVSVSKIANNRLYMIVTSKKNRFADPMIDIAELNTGKIVYRGIVSRKDNKELGNLQIYSISLGA